jgi:hypothetical protein
LEVVVDIPSAVISSKSVAWGGRSPELFQASQEAIRYAVQSSMQREQLRLWLESRTRLALSVEFHLSKQRACASDLDSLLSDLFNPLVEGACGPRPAGKPIPQTKDALFWSVEARKIESVEERTLVRISLLDEQIA